MTPETRERLGMLVERRLAGLLGETETAELATLLNESEEAQELYLRAVEFHIDLGTAPRVPVAAKGAGAPAEASGEKRVRSWVYRFASVQVAAGFLLVAVFVGFWILDQPPAPEVARDFRLEKQHVPEAAKLSPVRPENPPPPVNNSNPIPELKRQVLEAVWLSNMTAIVSECMRYRNLANDWAVLQADMANYERRIGYNLNVIFRMGERLPLGDYLRQGDQIIGFGQSDFTTMKPGEAAAVLSTWVSNWRPGTTLEQVVIMRGGRDLTLHLQFPEDTRELQKLVRHPALQLEGGGVIPELVVIPAELIQNVNTSFNALPPGYRSILAPADRKRLEDLRAGKKGSADDIEWLKTRVLNEVLPAFQREAELIRSQVLALEQKLEESTLTDVIYLKNRNKIEGQIYGQTANEVKVKTRFGAASIPMSEIRLIDRGVSVVTEFRRRYAEAKGNLEKLSLLLAWCTETNLNLEKEYVAYVILTLDASHEKARSAIGPGLPSVAAVIQPPAKDPSDGDFARIQALNTALSKIAVEVVARNQSFSDVVVEMRRQTEGMTVNRMPLMLGSIAKGVLMIQDPLTFDPTKLTAPNAVEMGTWWASLSKSDRLYFAVYYGLWCAFQRGRK